MPKPRHLAIALHLRDALQQRRITAGTTVCLVTHDAQEAVRLAHYIYCLRAKSAHPALRGIEEAALSD